MAASAGSWTFILLATSPIALMKQADQPAANNCSGLVPVPGTPGAENLTSKRPSSLRRRRRADRPKYPSWRCTAPLCLPALIQLRSFSDLSSLSPIVSFCFVLSGATNGPRAHRRPRGAPLLLLDLPGPGREQRRQRLLRPRFFPLAAMSLESPWDYPCALAYPPRQGLQR